MLYTIGWLAWIAWFLAEEGYALYHENWPGTLSWHVWAWFAVKDKGQAWRLRRTLLLAFLVWLTVHFLGGGAIV